MLTDLLTRHQRRAVRIVVALSLALTPRSVELVTDASKLIDRWPVLAQQLHRALISADEDELATQVNELRIVEMCGCDDDFCQSFYTEPPPSGAFP